MKYIKTITIAIIILTTCQCASATDISISGIWEGRKEGVKFFLRGNFSWGENVFSTSSVIIDLDDSEDPRIASHAGGVFSITDRQFQGNKITLFGYYSEDLNERRRIFITVIDENTITIDLEGMHPSWLDRHEGSNVFHRVPVDAPFTSIWPEGP